MAVQGQDCLVLDVGKTNVKIHVLNDHQESLALHNRANTRLDSVPYPQADVDGIWEWMMAVFSSVSGQFDIGSIAVTTHGATAALVDTKRGGNGLVLPVLDYEWTGVDPSGFYEEIRPAFSQTCSPGLPAGLNLGRQIYWQCSAFPELFAQVEAILLYPQYWVWRLSGQLATEVSSLGAHTDLWSPTKGDFSTLVDRQGWRDLFPPIVPAWKSVGGLSDTVCGETGLSKNCRVHAGVHDSNASFLRFLLAVPNRDFCVVSTGTWVICMSSTKPVGILDETRDMLANIDVTGDMIPCTRFMGGREYAEICRLTGTVSERLVGGKEVASIIANGQFALPDFSGGSGPFGNRGPQIPTQPVDGNALATLYCALMIDYSLDLLRSEGDVFIAGGFLKNPLLCSLVAQLRSGQPVYLSGDTAGTVRGASQLVNWARPVSVSLNRCKPTRIKGLKVYSARWRELAEG